MSHGLERAFRSLDRMDESIKKLDDLRLRLENSPNNHRKSLENLFETEVRYLREQLLCPGSASAYQSWLDAYRRKRT